MIRLILSNDDTRGGRRSAGCEGVVNMKYHLFPNHLSSDKWNALGCQFIFDSFHPAHVHLLIAW